MLTRRCTDWYSELAAISMQLLLEKHIIVQAEEHVVHAGRTLLAYDYAEVSFASQAI